MATMRKCEVCGKDVKVYPYQKRKRFCSRKCAAELSRARMTKHGMSRTRIYQIWSDMKSRCSGTPTSKKVAAWYGHASVCDSWRRSFMVFYRWAMRTGYEDHLELDRKDCDKGYSPRNCRWATRGQQMFNTRKRRNATTSKFKGVSWCSNVSKWRVQIGLNGRTIHIGLFANEVEAAFAYDREARELFGEFASTNF